ncbi:hypothetical protein SPRG_04590 [Saprolegnia parasitica CBS 223.65]|uniref:Uncharacterized protein n=1 Tax=Saprolegnia parasitica (strain CBS 223.65) TaxID=695850 RepID=A0A067CJN2_SAPPC|nr:hypothetical protein SPRG_04590 [Saprolegnia parasitica CBS 223.65]KDO30688.1 hypothetical protein SPRG_04590 [Saprolegnia parasitica CBS 223.65]|eukprot:XP_012198392.1 hypothetical protein SPRG_04590 [Saprolegnia parasitica CBS 223.65]
MSELVASDWARRADLAAIELAMLQLVDGLDRFGADARDKLASLNQKLGVLERSVKYMEQSLRGDPPVAY